MILENGVSKVNNIENMGIEIAFKAIFYLVLDNYLNVYCIIF